MGSGTDVPDTPVAADPQSSPQAATRTSPLIADARRKILEAWDELPSHFPRTRKWTDRRQRKLRARLADPDWLDDCLAAIQRIPQSSFLSGKSGKWIANIDWLLQPDSVTKVLEGFYDDRVCDAQHSNLVDISKVPLGAQENTHD